MTDKATGRNTDSVTKALGVHDDLLVVKLDETSPDDASTAVAAAAEHFGQIDVLVNNAGNFYAGFFEEITPDDFRSQVETNFFGPVNLTRAVLPVMRGQRSGLIIQISSTAGIMGQEFVSAYSASKFAVEGWIESLAPEVAPFGHGVEQHDGRQGGDPAKLADALVQLAGHDEPPFRWAAGADAVETFETKANEILEQANAHRELSSSLAHEDAS